MNTLSDRGDSSGTVQAAWLANLPNDYQLNAIIEANLHLLDDKARKALTFTRWKDGIDCDYLTVECRGFVAGILLHLARNGAGNASPTNK